MTADTYIVADIGGTNARFAHVSGGSIELRNIESFPCANFSNLSGAINRYLETSHLGAPAAVCLAVAGPVDTDWIDLPNSHWAFSQADIARELGTRLQVINDFTAQMLSIDILATSDFYWLGTARPRGQGIKAVIGPGTGLGVSALLPSGEILPSEGGHMGFAPANPHESDLLKVLWQRFPRVSTERVLSGPGLENLYWANARLAGNNHELAAEDISAGARSGDPACLQAITDFFSILASWAGDIVLMTGAADGVYLSGGIVPQIRDLMDEHTFCRQFRDKGRLTPLVANVPLALVEAEHPGLSGCVRALSLDRYD